MTAITRYIDKPQIPALTGIAEELQRVLAPMKQTIEVVAGRRGQRLSQLSGTVTADDMAERINEIIRVMQDGDGTTARIDEVVYAPEDGRTLEERLEELVVNVKDFGAVGDGVVDDSAAIQAAIDTIPETGGPPVYFPPGVYAIYTGITALNKPGIRLMGAGYAHRAPFRNDLAAIGRGSMLMGMTPGMTVLRVGRSGGGGTGGTSTYGGVFAHQGPEVSHLSIHDGTWSQPLISGTITWTLVSGTRYQILYAASLQLSGQRDFVVGDMVYFSDRWDTTVLSGEIFEVLAVGTSGSNKYIEIDTGTALPASGSLTSRPFCLETLIDETSMTLLRLDSYSRFKIDRCDFSLGEIGLLVNNDTNGSQNKNDLSWGVISDCTFIINKFGIILDPDAGGAVSSIVRGGDFSVPSGGKGISVSETSSAVFTNLIIDGMKMDIGKNTNTRGDLAVGIDMRACSNFEVRGVRYEILGDATCVRIGDGGSTFGKIHGCGFQGNVPESGIMEGTAVLLKNPTGITNPLSMAYGVSVFGNSSNGVGTFCHLSGLTHGNNVFGNTVIAGNYGVRIDSGSYLNNVFGNNRPRTDAMSGAWIEDSGYQNNVYMNNNGAGPVFDYIPTRSPLIVEAADADKTAMEVYPSRAYTPDDLVLVRIEAADITDSFVRADVTPPGNTDTGETWAVQSSIPVAAGAGTWRITSNDLARDYQTFGGSSVLSSITVPASADCTVIADVTTTATADRTQNGVVVRSVDGQNFLYFELQSIATSKTIRLRKAVAGTSTTLQSLSVTIAAGTSYELKVVCRKENIKCYLDGTKVLDYNLTTAEQATFLTASNVGLMSVTGSTQDDGGARWTAFEVQYTEGAFSVRSDGLPSWKLSSMQQTTVGAAGAASALPANPTRYLKVDYNGTTLVIPAYAAS